jgi:energy-coupling factor transport system substrate-specific component
VRSAALYLVSTALGLLAFLHPFVAPPDGPRGPLVAAALVSVALAALLIEAQGEALGAKVVTTLGVLVAIGAVLRFVEVAIPGPGGFSPMFAPIILAGYVFGPRFGFLLGALTLLLSALVTGGVGPWLPYQMMAAGWTGLSAGLLGLGLRARLPRHLETALLGLFGAAWGFGYGAIMNLYAWPFVAGPADQHWAPGLALADTVGRYALFYASTSLWWDVASAVGNLLLIGAFGGPLIGAFARFQRRFQVTIEPT